MKNLIYSLCLAIMVCIVIPGILFTSISRYKNEICTMLPTDQTGAPAAASSEDVSGLDETTVPEVPKAFTVSVLFDDGHLETQNLEEYITGVVLGEMPVSFDEEAIKAQAVVARTFSLRRIQKADKHSDGAVCTDPGCCQAYISPEKYISELGGTDESLDKVRSCVQATAGKVVTYQGEYIEATYFSSSGGSTENAVAVWGSEVPYLQARESPGEADAHVQSETIPCRKLISLLGLPDRQVSVDYVSYTEGKGVEEICLSGKIFKGTQIRSKLNLSSTMFQITVMGENATITTRGFGHRVGMSQYGADAMAKNGASYEEILSYYYPGTSLETLGDH